MRRVTGGVAAPANRNARCSTDLQRGFSGRKGEDDRSLARELTGAFAASEVSEMEVTEPPTI